MANKITTVFDADAKGFKSGVGAIKQSVREADGVLGKFKAGIKSAVGEFRSSNAAQAAAIGALAVGASKAIDAAVDLNESVNAVRVTFGDAAEDVLAIGENAAESFGLAQSEFNGFAVQFSAFAQQVAQRDGREVGEVVEELMTRVSDFASVMNLDVPQAAQVFQSALAGETEPIRKFGKDLSAAAVENYALANGLAASKAEMDESVKVAARYGLLMEQTADTAGDFANTSDELANSQRIAAAQAKDLAADIGQTLAPALGTVVQGLSEIMNLLDTLGFDEFTEFIGELDQHALSWGRSLRTAFDETAKANWENVESFEAAETAVAGFDKSLLDNVETFDEALAIATEYASGIADTEHQMHAANTIALEWKRTTEEATRAEEEAAEAARVQAEATAAAKREMALSNAELKVLNEQYDHLGPAIDESAEAAQTLTEKFADLRGEIEDREAYRDLQDAFDDLETAAQEAWTAAAEGADDAEQKARDYERAQDDLRIAVMDYAEEVGDLPDKVTSDILAMIEEGSVAQAEETLERIRRDREAHINVVTLVNGTRVNPDLTGGGPVVRIQPQPGQLVVGAEGAVVNRPTGAVIGERGPEAVVPLHKLPGNDPIESLIGRRNGHGGGPVYQITVNAGMGTDGDRVGQQIIDQIKRFERRNGTGWRN